MVGYRKESGRRKDQRAHMAKRQGKSDRQDMERSRGERGAPAGSPPQGASKRENSYSKDWGESTVGAAGRYSVAIMTKEDMRQIIAAYAACLEHSASFPAKCAIVERAKDGMFSLHIIVSFLPPKRSVRSSRLDQIASGKP